jgi:hypothetical protein
MMSEGAGIERAQQGLCSSDANPHRNASALQDPGAQTDDQQCQSYGAKPGSEAYVNCRVEMAK